MQVDMPDITPNVLCTSSLTTIDDEPSSTSTRDTVEQKSQ